MFQHYFPTLLLQYRIHTEKYPEPVWEKESHMLSVQCHVNWLLRGCDYINCRCKKGNQNCGPGWFCSNCQNCSQYKDRCIDIEVEEDMVFNYQNPSDHFINNFFLEIFAKTNPKFFVNFRFL